MIAKVSLQLHLKHILKSFPENIEKIKPSKIPNMCSKQIAYHNCKQSYYHIRKLSDELCSEHNLSVIIPGGEGGKKYNGWQADKNSTAWKTQIRKDISAAIKSSSAYEEFLLLMRAKGYEIKGETFGEYALKFISFRPLGKDRFVRGSIKSLGKEYTNERIKERIELKRERKAVIPKRDCTDRRLIDTSDEKFQNSPGLQRWAAVENLKIASQAYNEAGSIAELEQKIAAASATGKEAKQTVRKLENLNQYLGRTEPPKKAQEQPDRDNKTLPVGDLPQSHTQHL